ncbi:hypothetical protein [Ureibacillus sinduriensis]|uniref:Lipoprotein n=1 Tax=Ureibacillus sinduriensis BLB-1 = JCM 15800 TaxID=1384057 RepID=A0A0A3HXY8_9BACL|nr:hypothetical protein [Ureibacillus sinduriensis]KGR77471.1 hypothetical protein CD33_02985 [Ureibacillus sinduriensis BLB-1 = JCM 15800]
MNKILYSLFLLFMVAGCSSVQQTESSSQASSYHFLPPTVHFKVADTTYSTEQGSYCWRDGNSAECLSLSSPAEIVEYKEPIEVSANKSITLLPERQPAQQTLNMTNTEDNISEEIEINKDNRFKTPKTKGVYVIEYYAVWEKDDKGTSGDSSYVFKIEVK